jgi:hypothetical protein
MLIAFRMEMKKKYGATLCVENYGIWFRKYVNFVVENKTIYKRSFIVYMGEVAIVCICVEHCLYILMKWKFECNDLKSSCKRSTV